MVCTNFIDVELNLATGEFKPYRKPNDSPVYINANSNHPKTITDQLPKMIEYRLSSLSSSAKVFENEVGPYQRALDNCGYNYE